MTERNIPEEPGAPIHDAAAFRRAGHRLIDEIADFFATLPERPIRHPASVQDVRQLIGQTSLPDAGTPLEALLAETAPLLFDHSVHNGHPRFFGYITASAAPLGALADMLAASVNSNLALWDLSPVASEIETQTIRWLAELVGFQDANSNECGGIMVSGGNMANMLAFLAARRAHASADFRAAGLQEEDRRMTAYCAAETHTWIQKAADISGLGTDAIRWIDTDDKQRMDIAALRHRLAADVAAGFRPFIIVGTAGTVSTAAIDPLPAIHDIAREFGAWFHVDGAYDAPAAVLPEAAPDLKGLALADSIALDPHKWLYAPLEAACTLVRDPQTLLDAFSYRPPYYRIDEHDEESGNDYFELGLQNSRGFRALKVWLALRNCGRSGYIELIRNDIARAKELFDAADAHAELEACTLSLSIATFRYVPTDLTPGTNRVETYLNKLNTALLTTLQDSGELYVSNAVLGDTYVLRACVVNFRTTSADTAAVPTIVAAAGRRLDTCLRPDGLRE
jgi:aromatic-L-amino-acid decarboxylase